MIAKESIEQLKATLDIVEVLGSYIQLKRAGMNYSACCPFHDEKTPSFMVSPSKGIYHCYGCGVGGDTIKFVMEYEKLSFTEAIEKISSIVGFTLTYTKENQRQDSKFMEKVVEFYHKKLYQTPQALEYAKNRGISEESIKRFMLGMSGAGFESVKFADMHNARKEAIEYGLLGQDDQRVYARFFDRLMFPIYSANGKPVGFGGRAMGENSAKYINSPQTKFFNKSKLLYAYHLAKESIYSQKQIIITEGYIDVIMLHQAGFKNVVATLGTALTQEHLPLLSKGDPQIIVSYDGDQAGINAAFKASKILALAGKEGGVVIFGNGADPADMIVAHKEEEVKALFASPIPFVEFVLDFIARSYDIHHPLQKEKALKECLEFLHSLSPVMQEEYKSFVARVLKLPLNLIRTKKSYTPSSQGKALQKQDISELILIRSMLESEECMEFGLEYLESEYFEFASNEFEMILRGEGSKLGAILIDEGIKPLKFEEFCLQVKQRVILYCQKQLKNITILTGLDFTQKREKMQFYRQKIEQIKKEIP